MKIKNWDFPFCALPKSKGVENFGKINHIHVKKQKAALKKQPSTRLTAVV